MRTLISCFRKFPFAAMVLMCAQPAWAAGDWSDWVNSAQVNWANSKLPLAESEFKQSLVSAESSENNWQKQWSHLYLGLLYLTERKYPFAQKELSAVLQISQEGAIAGSARKSLAQVYYLQGNKPAALRLKARIDSDQPKNSVYRDYMEALQNKIKEQWKPKKLATSASTIVSFYLDQFGTPEEVHIASSSGLFLADQKALAAIDAIPTFGKIPVGGENPVIEMVFDFNYHQKAEGPKTGIRAGFGHVALNSSSMESNLAQQKQKLAAREQTLKRELLAIDTNSETPSTAAIQKREQLMDCLFDEKKYAEVKEIASALCSFFEKNEKEDLLAVHALMRFGEISIEEGNITRARDYFERAMNMSKKIKPDGSSEERASMLAFAKCLYRLGDTDAANHLYEKLKAYKSEVHK